jgi:hypothetical protein
MAQHEAQRLRLARSDVRFAWPGGIGELTNEFRQ